ncbi:MAG: hypothetical protein NVS1B3_02340 [Candidatus Dormibacteraceae bacterium]
MTMRAIGIRIGQLWGRLWGRQLTVAILSLALGTLTGAVMDYMIVNIPAPLLTILPKSLTVPADRLATLVTLVLGGMALSVALAAPGPVELLRED